MHKHLLILLSLAMLTLGMASTQAKEAGSQKQADTVVKFRQSLLQLVRSNMGSLGAMAKGNIPFDTDVMQKNGMRIEQLSLMMPDYFMTDTRGFETKTEAKPEIWDNNEDFAEKMQALTDAAKGLQMAAASGDESSYGKAIGAVGAACKSCHDKYKMD